MSKYESADELERLIYGHEYGSCRFELLKLCFPWMKGVSVVSAEAGTHECVVECKKECSIGIPEANNLGKSLSYLTSCTLTLKSFDGHGGYGGAVLRYGMKSGHPWVEPGLNDNVYIPDDNPKSFYHGGPL